MLLGNFYLVPTGVFFGWDPHRIYLPFRSIERVSIIAEKDDSGAMQKLRQGQPQSEAWCTRCIKLEFIVTGPYYDASGEGKIILIQCLSLSQAEAVAYMEKHNIEYTVFKSQRSRFRAGAQQRFIPAGERRRT